MNKIAEKKSRLFENLITNILVFGVSTIIPFCVLKKNSS